MEDDTNEGRELHVFQFSAFLSLCRHLLPSIRNGWKEQKQNEHLPTNVVTFLRSVLDLTHDEVHVLWERCKGEINQEDPNWLQDIMPSPMSSAESISLLYSLNLRE